MENGPFIDGLPNLKMVIFHGYVSHNQMVYHLGLPWARWRKWVYHGYLFLAQELSCRVVTALFLCINLPDVYRERLIGTRA